MSKIFHYFKKISKENQPENNIVLQPVNVKNIVQAEKENVEPSKNHKAIRMSSNNSDDEDFKEIKRYKRLTRDSESDVQSEAKKMKIDHRKVANEVPYDMKNIKDFNIENNQSTWAKSLLESFSLKTDAKPLQFDNVNFDSTELADWEQNYPHLNYDFLKSENIRDSCNRKINDPNYDPTSLLVPEKFMKDFTPAMKQWWKIKANGMMKTILFFKVGKFYETYHMDAVVTMKELNLSNMRGHYAHTGFPENAFTKMVDQLNVKGYDVARIEQMETPDDMKKRVLQSKSKDKVVGREVCQILTPGTRGFILVNNICNEDKVGYEEAMDDDISGVMYAYRESIIDDGFKSKSKFTVHIGIAIVHSNSSKFTIAQFADDDQRSRFRTLLSRYPPNEILYLKGNLSKHTQSVFNTSLAAIKKESLNTKQFLSSDQALSRLLESGYFVDTPLCKLSPLGLPVGLTEALNENDNLGRTASPKYELAINCVGALIYYLEKCLVDKYLISAADFDIYKPSDGCDTSIIAGSVDEPFYNYQKHMVLDSNTLTNLDILRNNTIGGREGTLLERLDHTFTSFGRRLLVQWIAAPLSDPEMIKARQQAIKSLMDLDSELNPVKATLQTLPDLEKLIARIHILGLNNSIKQHPDTRAQLFDDHVYSKRKINDFLTALHAFEKILDIRKRFSNLKDRIQSDYLRNLILSKDDDVNGAFPAIAEAIESLLNFFDVNKAKETGCIIPHKGTDNGYDAVINEIENVDKKLDSYLNEQKQRMRCNIKYFGSAKCRYQLEIPVSHKNSVPKEYELSSDRKGYVRYVTPTTREYLHQMIAAEEARDNVLKTMMCTLFSKFDSHYAQWSNAINSIAKLDVLFSLAKFSKGLDGGPMTLPEIRPITPNSKANLLITEGRYPCKARTQAGEFISNTVKLGSFLPNGDQFEENKSVMLLTGPNMGGKSTLMRQTALIIILSQMGCYVPAEGPVILTPIDRLFTRQGANDSIGTGQSTLQVEMNEAALILSYMTENSLLLIDELGRGTATYDGFALAYAILKEIVERLSPRTIFCTHFHKLLDETALTKQLQICHMACMVEEDEVNPDFNLTFLYKLTSGGCPKSYGFNAARLANIPETIILEGFKKARLFEEATLIAEFKKYLRIGNVTKDSLKNWQLRFSQIYKIK